MLEGSQLSISLALVSTPLKRQRAIQMRNVEPAETLALHSMCSAVSKCHWESLDGSWRSSHYQPHIGRARPAQCCWKKKRTSESQDPWIHVLNANVEVPSFRHLSLVGVLPWYKPNINAQRRKRFLSFSIILVSMLRQRNQGANFKCFTTAANWLCSLAAASSSWIVTMEELWTNSMRHQNIRDCNDRIHQLTSLAKCGMNGMNDLNDHLIMRLHHGGGPHTKWSKCTQHRASVRCRCWFHEALELSWIIWHRGWNHVFIVT